MQNININAYGSFQGGEYDSVEINGTATCDGDLICKTVEINGALKTGALNTVCLENNGVLKANGPVVAENTEVNGSMTVEGDFQTNSLEVNGNLSVHGALNAGNTSVDGRLKCENAVNVGDLDCDGTATFCSGLSARKIDADGLLSVTGNIEAESIETEGKVTCTAQISADTIRFFGTVSADEIVGDHIEIKYEDFTGMAASLMNTIFGSKLVNEAKCANLIEATTIELAGVCAGVVSGENVIIGKNCRIDRLDCTGNFTIDPSSTVRLLNGEPYMG